jgi:2'-5' RNA ligase
MGIRSFLALPISGGVKEKLKHILLDLQLIQADVKWVKLENIHLTLKFLGDVDEDRLECVADILKKCCPGFVPCAAQLIAIGAFPDLRHPKILWGALDDSNKKILAYVDVLEGEMARSGFTKEERPFKPHLTIGRVRSNTNLNQLIHAIRKITFEDKIEQVFDKIILFKSTLTSQGPEYEVLKEFKIGP